MGNYILYVTYIAKQGMRESYVNEVVESGLREKILKENGCLGYDYFYSAQKENELLLIERWADHEKQIAHTKHPNMTQLKSIKEKYLLQTDIKKISFKE